MKKYKKQKRDKRKLLATISVSYFHFSLIFFSFLSYKPISAEYSPSNTPIDESLTTKKNEKIKLSNLNPWINKWFILEIEGKKKLNLHLENSFNQNKLSLTENGISIRNPNIDKPIECELWSDSAPIVYDANFSQHPSPYFPICHSLLYIRLDRPSNTTLSTTEKVTEILRDYTDWGESLISSIKPHLVRFSAEEAKSNLIAMIDGKEQAQEKSPISASVKRVDNKALASSQNSLGIDIESSGKELLFGEWYETKLYKDIYVSLFMPELIPDEIANSYPDITKEISESEKNKLIYLTAYDLSAYSLNYAIGTTHPGIDNKAIVADTNSSGAHIVPIGQIPPYHMEDSTSVFIGGFKAQHGVFNKGPHKGKVYGYIENGIEMREMSPGLATLLTYIDGTVDIIKWPAAIWHEDSLRKSVVSARQNGVPIVYDSKPGSYVASWGNGNWSGSSSGDLKTLRSSVCIQKRDSKRFLIFAGFTYATPSTMAKALQAYSCESAMHLDMNAYMYLHNAIFKTEKDAITVQYLHKEMEYPKGIKKHRFILDNNSRDFFYVYKSAKAK